MKYYKHANEKIWKQWYGNALIVRDISNRIIDFTQFGTDSEYAWSIDHIMPISQGGTDLLENLIPVNKLTNTEKGNAFPVFTVNNKTIVIKPIKKERNGSLKNGWTFLDENDRKII